MKYCNKCLQPDSRPGIYFDENGVCGACLWNEEIGRIDWVARRRELMDIAENAKLKASGCYDCAIGVSGGKDSTFQAFYARDILKLRVLLVNCQPSDISPLGLANIENLKNHGFDVISIDPNRKLLRRMMQHDFYKYLNPIKCTEYPLYASTYIMADRFDIPLIIQGENAALTLGTSKMMTAGGDCFNVTSSNTLKEDPVKEYVSAGIAEEKDLFMYRFPIEKLLEKGVKGVWLNYYAKEWSQPGNARFSVENGLSIYPGDINPYEIGTYRRYSQLDSYVVPCNQLFKYMKFGFGQATDHVCYDIREGFITRDEGKYLVKELDGRCGNFYLEKMAGYLDIGVTEMLAYAEKFRGGMFEGGKLKEPIWEAEGIEGQHNLQDIMRRLKI